MPSLHQHVLNLHHIINPLVSGLIGEEAPAATVPDIGLQEGHQSVAFSPRPLESKYHRNPTDEGAASTVLRFTPISAAKLGTPGIEVVQRPRRSSPL